MAVDSALLLGSGTGALLLGFFIESRLVAIGQEEVGGLVAIVGGGLCVAFVLYWLASLLRLDGRLREIELAERSGFTNVVWGTGRVSQTVAAHRAAPAYVTRGVTSLPLDFSIMADGAGISAWGGARQSPHLLWLLPWRDIHSVTVEALHFGGSLALGIRVHAVCEGTHLSFETPSNGRGPGALWPLSRPELDATVTRIMAQRDVGIAVPRESDESS
ncbi:hypothetical protein [Agromyces sp. SYSU T0242]|uniref:hypothetical protein n=1 Tax=Agromyces litoreus TaxID=3158561 RepID=UPI0033950C46